MRLRQIRLVAIASLVCVWGAADAGAQCMLANPSFELTGSGTVFAGWNQFGPVGASAPAAHGAVAAKVTGPNSGSWNVSGYWQSLACAPGQQWSASVCVMHSSASPLRGGSQAILNIEWHDGTGSMISYETHTLANGSTAENVWRVVSVQSGVAPAGTASIHFLLGVLQGPADPTPEVMFDNATCVSVGPPTHESLQWNDFAGGRTVAFSGRTWRVKGPGYFGPGPNLFDNGTGAVSVDPAGRLHLTIHKIGASWYSSEVTLVDPLGYGDYVFTTRGHLDLFDRNTVLGMFVWEYGACYDTGYLWWNPYNEIDIEFSRWGSASNADAQFVAQPADWGGNISRFNAAFGDTEITSHAMRWLPQSVEFRSWRGGPDAESPATMIASWTYAGPHIPRPESPRVHLNMWQLAAPVVTQEAVFQAFTFRPACPSGNCGVLAADPPRAAEPATRLAAASPNPFATETTIRYEIATAGTVELAIYDVAGRRVARLASGTFAAGAHTARWDGRDAAGRRVPAGIYLCRLRTPASSETRRIVVTE